MSSTKPSQQKATKAIAAKADGEQRAFWTTADETALILFLVEHRPEAGNGFNFKTSTFNAASLVVNAMKTKGGTKTSKVCKNKWAQVHYTATWSDFMSAVAFLMTFSAQRSVFSRFSTQGTVRVQVG